MGFHKNLIGDDLHGIRPKTTDISPVGAITPEYIGEVIINTATSTFYRATGETANDWIIVGGAGDISKLSELSDIDISSRNDESIIQWSSERNVYEHTLLNPSDSTVYVDASIGSDDTGNGTINKPYKTIKHAISTITDNSETIRYEIVLAPDVYIEDNPLPLKNYVNIAGNSAFVTRVEAQNTTLPMFEVPVTPVLSEVRNITVYNAGLVINAADASVLIFRDVILLDCGSGYTYNATEGNNLSIIGGTCSTPTRTMDKFINCLSGRVTVRNYTFEDDVTITDIIDSDGADSFVVVNGMSCISTNVIRGFNTSNSSRMLFDGVLLENMHTAIYADTGSLVEGFSFAIDAGTYDVYQADDAEIRLSAGSLSNDRKVMVNNASNFRSNITYDELGSPTVGTHNTRDFFVGLPEKGRISVFGEGDKTGRGMIAYSFDGVSFTDVSVEAGSASGSAFSFPTTEGSGFYLSWDIIDSTDDYKQFLGFFINITSPLNVGAGSYVMEYYDGTDWSSVSRMITSNSSPYMTYAEKIEGLIGQYEVRLSCMLASSWVKNDPISSGTDRYWIRFRVVGAITQAPTIEQIQLHSNRMVIREDGWPEYFGKARPLGVLPWHMGLLEGAADTPASQDVYVSDHIQVGMSENDFSSVGDSSIGFITQLSFDVDTSCPLRFRFTWYGESNTAGTVAWTVRATYTSSGDDIYDSTSDAPTAHVNERSGTILVNVPTGGGYKQISSVVSVDISDLVSRRIDAYGDIMWVSLERAASSNVNDTYGGAAVVYSISPVHSRWCEGSHEESDIVA